MTRISTGFAPKSIGSQDHKLLLAGLPDPVIVIDENGCVCYGNRAVERVLGWTVVSQLGRSVLEVIHPDDQELVLLSMASIGQKETGTAIEVRVAHADGGWRHLEVIGSNLLDDPAVEGIVLIARDLTERRRWEVTGNDGERFRAVVHHAAAITMLVNRDGGVDSASGALTRLLGFDPELVAGRPLVDLIGERDRPHAEQMLARAATSAGQTSFETSFRHARSDRLLPVELSVMNLLDDPVVAGLIVTAQDISRLVAAREATARLAAVVEQSGDAMVGIAADGVIEHWNDGATRLTGVAPAQAVGQQITMLVTGDEVAALRGLMAEVRRGEVGRLETIFLRADESTVDVAITLSPIIDRDARLTRMALIARDITDRKRAEADLRKSQRQLAEAQRLACLGSWTWDIGTDVVSWSAELYRVFDISPQEFTASYAGYLDRIHPEDRARTKTIIGQALESGQPFNFVHRVVRPDGTTRVLRSLGAVATDGNGNPVSMSGTAQDVTDEQLALAALARAEERTRRMLATAHDGVVAMDAAGVVAEWNDAAERIFGWAHDEAIGRPLVELIIPPEQREAHRRGVARFLETAEGPLLGRTVEVNGVHRDGRQLPLELTIWALDVDREVQFNAFIRDVSQRYAAEQAVRESEQRFRVAFDDAPVGMSLVAPDGRFLRVNRSLCELVGRTPDQLLALTNQDITHPDDLQADLDFLRQLLAGERQSYDLEKRYVHAGGHVVWALLAVSLVRDTEGEPLYFIAQTEDITGRKESDTRLTQYAAELAVVNEALRAADEMKDHFVAVATHELRSPLTSILGFTSLLRERWETLADVDRLEFLDVVDRQGRRLQTIVDNLLTLSTIEAGGLDSNAQPVTVIDVVHDVLRANAAGRDFAVTCPPDVEVVADPGQLEQILTNYVTNAVKYGAPPFSVDVRDKGETFDIAVCDRGPGVPDEFVARLFEKFTQAPSRTNRRGAGLGLAIVRSLAEAQGGEAWYEPNPPSGSCFAVRLPKPQPTARSAK